MVNLNNSRILKGLPTSAVLCIAFSVLLIVSSGNPLSTGVDSIGSRPLFEGEKGAVRLEDFRSRPPSPADTTTFPWPMHLYNEMHRAFTPSPAPETNDVLWSNITGFNTYSSPAVAEGKVFIGGSDSTGDYMYAFYQNNGTLAWRTKTYETVSGGVGLSSSPAYSNGYVVFGGDRIYCLYASNGTVKWTVEPGNLNWGDGSPTIADGKVFIGGSDRKIYNIDLETGTVLWTFQTLSSGGSNWGLYAAPAVWNGHVYVAACDGYMYQIKIDQPGPIAVANHSFYTGYAMYGSPVIFDGKVYIGNGYTFKSTSNRFYCLNATDLSLIWEFYPGNATSFFSSAGIAYDKVFVGSVDGNLYVLDPWGSGGTTSVIWQYFIGETWSSPAISSGQVFIGAKNGFLYAFNESQTGPANYKWRYDTRGAVDSSPAVSDGRLYVGTHGDGGRVYCFGQPGDVIPPRAETFSPVGTDVPIDANISIVWSEIMDWASVQSSFSYTDGVTVWDASDGFFAHDPSALTSTFDPFNYFSYSTTYWVMFTALAADPAGNPLDGDGDGFGGDDLTWSFTTVSDNPPALELWEPGGVPGESYQVGTSISIRWSAGDDNPWPQGGMVVNLSYGTSPSGGIPIAQYEFEDGLFSWDTSGVSQGEYYVNISVYDSAGQISFGHSNFSFQISSVPNLPPTVSVTLPSGGECWTGGTTKIVSWEMVDDYTLDQNLVVYLNYTYSGGSGGIEGPLTGLSSPFSYTWTLPTIDGFDVVLLIDVIDENGATGSNSSSMFEVDSTPPAVVSHSPGDGETNVARNVKIVTTWSEGMNLSATNLSFSLLDNATWTPVPGTFAWSGGGTIMTFNPLVDLQPQSWYTVNLSTSAMDDSDPGNKLLTLYSWSFRTAMIADTTPPEIWDVQTVPLPQEVYYQVNISARIEDAFGIAEAYVRVDNPIGVPLGNFSMSYDPLTSRHYLLRSYEELGRFMCTLLARDRNGNWNFSGCQLVVLDTTPPTISDINKNPDPQEVFERVNISALVEDNYQLLDVILVISGVGSFIMTLDTGSGRYFHERGYDAPGSYTFWIFANDTMFNLASYLGTFNITDSTPPTISEVSSIPDPQEVFGRVNISAMVEDNYQLLDVAVSIADTGTFPMAFDPSSGRYFHERRYDVLGTFTFWIFANDSFSNQADCTGIFNITDSVPPTIEDLWKIPDPQEVSGFVNISADVSDNYLLSSASINIQAIGNFSMSYDSSFGRFYCNRSYQVLGVHSFTIWASDSNGNWNFLSERFEIVDSLPPQISHTPPASVTVGSEVKIQANVSDNYQVASVWLNYTDTAEVHFNVSMSQLGGDSYGLTIPAQIEVGEVVYHIWAMDEAGNGASTQLYQVSVLAGEDRTIPRPPQNLRVQKGSDGGSAELSWEEPTLNEDGSPIEDLEGYNIYRLELESGTEVKLNQLPLESASYTDYSVGSGKTYQYQVTAVDSSGHESNYSNPAVIFFAEEDSLLVWEVLTIVILVLVVSLTLVLLLGRKKKGKVSEGEENDGSAAEEEHLSKEKSE